MILNGEGVTKDDEEAACNMRDCIALQLTQRPRGIQTLNIFWAARLRRVEVLRRTEWRRRDGSFLRRLGSMLMLNFSLVLLTKKAVAFCPRLIKSARSSLNVHDSSTPEN